MAPENEQSIPHGHQVIEGYLRRLDGSPGVYRMLDRQNRVLYVGKARNLRKRVASYAKPTGHSPRIARMISQTTEMMFLTTATETEALLLEQNLIKQLKPKYNVLLRDDKSFPYIFISSEHDFPRIEKHRGPKKRKGRYYGPFASAGAVKSTINTLQKLFLLRSCTDREVEAGDRPCLNYHLKRCAGPCGGKISKQEYAKLVQAADDFLSGKSTRAQETLAIDMERAAEAMEFERAASLRDRIRALTHLQTAQGINPRHVSDADIIALHLAEGQACIQVFFIRSHQNWGNRDYHPRIAGEENPAIIMQAFIGQFYDEREPPAQIILSHGVDDEDLIPELLSTKAGRKVSLVIPQRGEKAELVAHAMRNARESLVRKVSENTAQAKLLATLAETFELPKIPQRIEVYDNSHIQGSHAVGGMIVVGPEGFDKKQYRKFNIRGNGLTPGDDFGMMREVLTRRFQRLLKEDPERTDGMWPDLLLIDGGKGQVSAVQEVLVELGLTDVPMIGVAKGLERNAGKEEFHRVGRSAMALSHNHPVLYFVQRMRDEAHRWAIGAHRMKRSKAIDATPLDDLPGVGPTRKRALLAHFGSAKSVSRANIADLRAVNGISDTLAEAIYGHFHEKE